MKKLLVIYFDTEKNLINATKFATENKYLVKDVFTPYAVHGLDSAMKVKTSKLGIICFILGITGAFLKLYYQIWTSSTDWPVNVGGKPLNSFPAFIPVTFEVMVLLSGIGTTLIFLSSDWWRWRKKVKPNYKTTTDSEFAVVIEPTSAIYEFEKEKKNFKNYNYVRIEESLER